MSEKMQTVPVPVRFDKLTRERLSRAAQRLGSNRSAVVRFAVFTQLPLIESGRLVLAPETTK
jgi:hypothetical protein